MEIPIGFEQASCPNCQMIFFIPSVFKARLLECHNTFYCPSGHSMFYPQKTEKEEQIEHLKKELMTAKTQLSEIEKKKKGRKRRRVSR
jgi:hypothetical protein